MVEHFHWQLKSVLRALPDTSTWSESLPLISLGIGTALKEDLHASAAELVYGTTLHLPGEFFHSSMTSAGLTSYVSRLKSYMRQLQPNNISIDHLKPAHLDATDHEFLSQHNPLPPILTYSLHSHNVTLREEQKLLKLQGLVDKYIGLNISCLKTEPLGGEYCSGLLAQQYSLLLLQPHY